MILLDTHAVIWLAQGHRRARPLAGYARLAMSPATLLEIQFLEESGRVRLASGHAALIQDPRWRLDEPPAGKWFGVATDLAWTKDPFDRLLAAHALLRNWKLATADEALLDNLPASAVLAL